MYRPHLRLEEIGVRWMAIKMDTHGALLGERQDNESRSRPPLPSKDGALQEYLMPQKSTPMKVWLG